jgi:hypothetical protein
MMIVVDDDKRKIYKIENYQVSKISQVSQVELSFFSIFDFSKYFFQNLVRRG